MKNNIFLKLSGLIILIAVIGIYFRLNYLIPKTAYIDLNTAYNEFILKKELENKLNNVQQIRKTILDSLKLQLNVLYKQIEINGKKNQDYLEKYNVLKEEYYIKDKQFSEDNQTLTQKYNEQVWNQLNQYIQDYGKNHNYNYIFGGSGNGSLMYANDNNNITKEIVQYVNERYEDKK